MSFSLMGKFNLPVFLLEKKKQLIKIVISVLLLIMLDQITKLVAQSFLENNDNIPLITGVLNLRFIKNEIAGLHQYVIYFVLTLVIFPALIIYSIDKSLHKNIKIGLVLLWSAILSNNLIDVFLLGYIRDFINLQGVATGNIADQYRTLGAIYCIMGLIRNNEEKLSSNLIVKIVIGVIVVIIIMILYWRYLSKVIAI